MADIISSSNYDGYDSSAMSDKSINDIVTPVHEKTHKKLYTKSNTNKEKPWYHNTAFVFMLIFLCITCPIWILPVVIIVVLCSPVIVFIVLIYFLLHYRQVWDHVNNLERSPDRPIRERSWGDSHELSCVLVFLCLTFPIWILPTCVLVILFSVFCSPIVLLLISVYFLVHSKIWKTSP